MTFIISSSLYSAASEGIRHQSWVKPLFIHLWYQMRWSLKLTESLAGMFSGSVICVYIKVQVLAQTFTFRCPPCSHAGLTPLRLPFYVGIAEHGKQNMQTTGI